MVERNLPLPLPICTTASSSAVTERKDPCEDEWIQPLKPQDISSASSLPFSWLRRTAGREGVPPSG